MSENEPTTCPSCGALLADGAEVCDLCGTPIPSEPPAAEEGEETPTTHKGEEPHPEDSTESETIGEARGVFCNACGWQNPPGARYCSQCGSRLQDLSTPDTSTPDVPQEARSAATTVSADLPASPPESKAAPANGATSEDSEGMGRQVGLIVGVALLVVVGLFLVTTWSEQVEWGPSSESTAEAASSQRGGPARGATAASTTDLASLVEQNAQGDLPSQLVQRVDSLKAAIADQTGVRKRAAQRELVNAYVGAGHLGQAALVQKQIAEANDAPEAWRRTGDLLYSWMEALGGNQSAGRAVAEHVVSAYQRVLDQQPDNLDVRTDMATAMLQTSNPMRGVQEINRVLEKDPDHFQARFNKGIMLTMIGRTDDAIKEFERVKEIVGEESPYYQQANQAIQTIRQRGGAGAPSGMSGSSSSGNTGRSGSLPAQ